MRAHAHDLRAEVEDAPGPARSASDRCDALVHAIASDWRAVATLMGPGTVVLLDDYYRNEEPEVLGFGCQSLVDELDRSRYRVEILGPEDHFRKDWGVLHVSMVRVELRTPSA